MERHVNNFFIDVESFFAYCLQWPHMQLSRLTQMWEWMPQHEKLSIACDPLAKTCGGSLRLYADACHAFECVQACCDVALCVAMPWYARSIV